MKRTSEVPTGTADSDAEAQPQADRNAQRGLRAACGPGDSDEDMMLAYAAGDTVAFERLYDRHEAPVYRFLLRSVALASVADDLAQEVWLTVVRNCARYRPQAAFRTWLYRIARTRLIDHWRARDPAIVLSLDAPAANDPDQCGPTLGETVAGDESEQPVQRVMARAQALALLAAVQTLPAPQREVLLLHMEGELTLAQIAEVTGSGFETAKSRLRYALDKLRAVRQEWT
jgi:RNA polymerase sigma factor (sigma-70 family)